VPGWPPRDPDTHNTTAGRAFIVDRLTTRGNKKSRQNGKPKSAGEFPDSSGKGYAEYRVSSSRFAPGSGEKRPRALCIRLKARQDHTKLRQGLGKTQGKKCRAEEEELHEGACDTAQNTNLPQTGGKKKNKVNRTEEETKGK